MAFIAPEDELEVESFSAPDDELLQEDTGQGRASSMAGEFGRSLAKVGTGTVEGLGQFGSTFVRNLNPIGLAAHAGVPGAQELVDAYASIPEAIAGGAGKTQEFVEETVPINPLYADTAGQKMAGVTGQVGGQLATMLTGAAFTKAPKILQALGLGQAGLLGLETGYEEADRHGVTGWERDALAASYAAAEAGVEGMGGFGSRGFARALAGDVRDVLGKGAVKTLLKTAGIEGVEEPITGTLQSGASNVFAQEDPARPGFSITGQPLPSIDPTTGEFWKNRAEEFALGAYGGALFGGANFGLNRPTPQKLQNLKAKTDLTIEMYESKPDLTDEERQDLTELKALKPTLDARVQEIQIPQVAQRATEDAVLSAQEAGLPETAAVLEEVLNTPQVIEAEAGVVEDEPFVAPDDEVEVEPAPMVEPVIEEETVVEDETPREFQLSEFENEEKLAEGSESTVYRKGDKVLKVGEAYNDPASFEPRVASILRGDQEIGSGTLKLAGHYVSPNGVKNPVFRQPFIEGRAATDEEIKKHMTSKGFTHVPSRRMYVKQTPEGLLAASDLDGDNVKVTEDGKTEVIDATVFAPTPDPEIDAALGVAAVPAQESAPPVTEQPKAPTEADIESEWLSSQEFAQAEALAAEGRIEEAEQIEESFRESMTHQIAQKSTVTREEPKPQETPVKAKKAAKKAVSAQKKAPVVAEAPEGVDPHLVDLGRSPTTTAGDLSTELKEYTEKERSDLQKALKTTDNKPQTLAAALKKLQPKTGGTGSTYKTERQQGIRRDAVDEQLDREEGIVQARKYSVRRSAPKYTGIPIQVGEKMRKLLLDVIPGAKDAWIGLSKDVKDAPGLRQLFIHTERARDSSMSVEEADEKFDRFLEWLPGSRIEGFSVGGSIYMMTDKVGVSKEDGTPEMAARRVLLHEDAHPSTDAAIQNDPDLAQEWEEIKNDISPEELDSLAADRYPWLENWREDAAIHNELAQEWIAEQAEIHETQGIPLTGFMQRVMDFFRKILAKFMDQPVASISNPRVMDFLEAGRAWRAREIRASRPVTPSQQNLFPGMDHFSEAERDSPLRFSMQPNFGTATEERDAEYKEALNAIPESGKEYVQFLGSRTRTPRITQAVRPMVDFARSQMGSYQGGEVEVNEENTERVKELAAQAFQSGKAGAQFAEQWSEKFRDSGFSNQGQHLGSVAAGVLQMEILDYAVRLAGEGDKSLALALMPYANDVVASDHASISNAGRALQMRSMAGQQKGFWTILNSLAKGERELAEKNPIYKELREALFSDEVQSETAAGVAKDMDSEEAQKVLNPEVRPEDVLETYMPRAMGAMGEAERDITTKLFADMAELERLLGIQSAMQAPPVKASMQAASAASYENDPVGLQQKIDELKARISGGLKALDQFKTSVASKETRQKAINKTPRAKKALNADAQARKLLERLENKPKRTKQESPAWKKTFDQQVETPKTEAVFATEMASHGLSPEVATKLYEEAKKLTREAQDAKDAAERRKSDRKDTQKEVSAAKQRVREQKREMERPGRISDQKSFINEVMRQIFDGTIEEQENPNWRRMVMVEAFKKHGFSQGSAENAADYLGVSLDRNLRQAQEKAARKAAEGLKMKKPTLERLIQAIRSRAVDPLNADPVTKALAAEAGFAGITPEQFTRLAKLDGQMRSQYQTLRAKAAAEMLNIALAARPPKSRGDILTQAWISSALSSLSTMALSGVHAAFIPTRRLVTDFMGVATDVATGKTKPGDAAQMMVNMLGNLTHSASYMLASAKYAGLNDAYTQHIVEFINQMHSMQADLQRAVKVIKDPNASGLDKGKAAIKVAFTSTDIVRRILSTADETWGSMIQDFILRNEAMRQLVQKGNLTPEAAASIFVAASDRGRAAGDRHLSETGNALEAQLVERDAIQGELLEAVKGHLGEEAAADVGETASLESPMELGNRRAEDAPLWDFVNTGLEWVKQLAIATRRKNELIGRMITGFVTVPANILNRSAYFTPLGLVRALYKKGKIGGDPAKIREAYQETMKTEGQQRMRLIEGIVGTMLIAMLIALQADDDEEGLVVTGSGPQDRGLREAWMKKGNAPNRIQWVDKKGNVRFSVPYARGGFDHLNLPFTLVGTMDDMKLKGIKPKPANVEWGTQYVHTALKGLFDQAKFFGLKNVATMPTQNLTDKSLASQAAYLASPVVPWSGLTKSLGRMWTGPTDQSSVRSAVIAQLPFTNFYATPALNALGDQRGPAPTDAQWEKALMSGVPFIVGARNKGPDEDLYTMMIERGVAPNVPLRSTIERQNGLIPDSQWEQYLKTRGGLVKKGIRKNLRKFQLLPYKDAQNLMERISADSTREAKKKLRLQ